MCDTYLLNDLLIFLTIMHGNIYQLPPVFLVGSGEGVFFFLQISDKPFYHEWLI